MERKRYFESRFFKRIFFSYVLLICAFVLVYTVWYVASYRSRWRQDAEKTAAQQVTAYATAMDRQFFAGQSMIAAINSSETFRSIFQSAYVEKKTIDSMQYHRLQLEFKRIRGSAASVNIYSVMCCFQNDNKVYMPGGVVGFTGSPQMLQGNARPLVDTVANLLGVVNPSQILFNKKYLIYADNYTAFSERMPRGIVMVLFEESGLQKLTEGMLGMAVGASIDNDGEELMCFGEKQGRTFEAESLLGSDIRYRFYVPEAAFEAPFVSQVMLPMAAVLLLGLVFVPVTYDFSRRIYKPIGSISSMVDTRRHSGDDMDDLLLAISSLIGERNGYREKMITITPYAQQGMVQSLISGAQSRRLDLLTGNEFLNLKKPYFTVALVNIVHIDDGQKPHAPLEDVQTRIRQVCEEMTTPEQNVVCTGMNLQNMAVIVNRDGTQGIKELFTTLHERIMDVMEDPRYAVTIGVSATQSDLNSLRDALGGAQQALKHMLTGGRGRVYFDGSAAEEDKRRYYFPKDAQKRMVKSLKEGNLAELEAQLEEICRQNMQEVELPAGELEMMLEELHYTVSAALRSVYDSSTVHVRIERLRDTMTLHEIFAYYKSVFATALSALAEQRTPQPDDLENRVCDYIGEHYCDPDLSLNMLADHFGVSTKAIGAICKKRYNTTFLQYLRERQIGRAVELLRDTGLPLEAIAKQCGFINVLTFRRNFKAIMNRNPSDFRH